ncbi:tRNA(Arg) A34 adenosine deaminase TadA [Prauserella aidingensis]|uniref:nucleoside deaminase n=1 Tax=Prauserella aidingensis TaxID=387890 RepID=UPI0020A57451|nr:nucleoside deaminase [Prauserella aidingensis]MCP2252390.1 tRNA(Arg) A34 adenosine deaminase TadA [Prauserella aidingensis]
MSADPAVLHSAMARAVEFGLRHVESGGLPFVGVLVAGDGRVSAPGVNRVRETADPTAHAEIVAIRRALDDPGGPPVPGATLLATGEPCVLCYDVAAEHGVGEVRYAVSAETAAAWGFDYRSCAAARPALEATARALPVDGALRPFARYRALHGTR